MNNLWNSSIEGSHNALVEQATKEATDMFQPILDRTPAAVLNLPGAVADIERYKIAVMKGVNTVRQKSSEVGNLIDTISSLSDALKNNVDDKRTQVTNMGKTVSDAQVLFDIRKEQAAALETKYGSNLHTSWLGLWRPLSDQGRTALTICAIVFGLIALAVIIYGVKMYFLPAQPSGLMQSFMGGFRLSRRK